jgi:hypothetical protein
MSGLSEAAASSTAGSTNGERPSDERPIGEIVRDLWLNTETLIRQEMQLGLADAEQRVQTFKSQIDEEVDALKRELILKAIGGAVALIGLSVLVASLVLVLAEVMPAWLSALIVGLVIVGGSTALLLRSKPPSNLPEVRELVPQRAVQSVKEDVRTVQEAIK